MNQRITVELLDDVASHLAELAEERGVTVEAIAAEYIAAQAASAEKTVLDVMDDVLGEFHELHRRLA